MVNKHVRKIKPSEKRAIAKRKKNGDPPVVQEQAAARPARTGARASDLARPTGAPSSAVPAGTGAPAGPSAVDTPPSGSHVNGDPGAVASEQQTRVPVRIEEIPELADVLPGLAAKYRQVHGAILILEEEKKELASMIQPLLEAAGQNDVLGDTWEAIRARGQSVSISKERLLEKGVSITVVEYATVRKPYWYIQVLKRGEGEGGGR